MTVSGLRFKNVDSKCENGNDQVIIPHAIIKPIQYVSEHNIKAETSSKYYDEGIQEKDQKSICKWINCEHIFESIDKLYDHVVENHIKPKLSLIKAGEIECEWDDCDMEISRGDIGKKIEWLEQHYRTRHALGAKTFKCVIEGCKMRASTSRQVEDHVRLAHIDGGICKIKKAFKKVDFLPNKSGFQWTPQNIFPRFKSKSSINWTDVDTLRMFQRNLFAFENENHVKAIIINRCHECGSKKRKMGFEGNLRNWYKLIKCDPNQKRIKCKIEEKFDIENEEKITLDDLFSNISKSENKNDNEEFEWVYSIIEKKEEKEFKSELNKKRKYGKNKEIKKIGEDVPLKKRTRRSLPYGVFEEDSTDNEEDFGYERLPEKLLKNVEKKKNEEIKLEKDENTCKYDEIAILKYAEIHKLMADCLDIFQHSPSAQ